MSNRPKGTKASKRQESHKKNDGLMFPIPDQETAAFGAFGFEWQSGQIFSRYDSPIQAFAEIPTLHARFRLDFKSDGKEPHVDEETGTIHIPCPVQDTGFQYCYRLYAGDSEELALLDVTAMFTIALNRAPGILSVAWRIYIKYPVERQTEELVREHLQSMATLAGVDKARDLGDLLEPARGQLRSLVEIQEEAVKMQDNDPSKADYLEPVAPGPLALRQIVAMERLADELAESNRLQRLALKSSPCSPSVEQKDDLEGRLDLTDYSDTDDVAEILNAVPDGMFDDVEW